MAVKMAPVVAGFEATTGKMRIISLFDAFQKSLSASKRGERSRKDWNESVLTFSEYLKEKYSNVGNWNQLSRAIVRGYDETLSEKSENRRRLLLQPIVQTDGYMSREFGFERVAEGLRLSSKTVKAPCRIHLIDALEFLGYLAENAPQLQAPVALQFLAGMRLEEVYRMSWASVDLVRGLVQVSGDDRNVWCERLIPICARALEILKRAKAQQSKILNVGADMLVPNYCESGNYSKAITKEIKKWNALIDWRPGDFRNLLPTWATAQGCKDDLWEQYIGHAPSGVTARHYVPRLAAASTGEQEETDAAMEIFKQAITKRLDAAIIKAEAEKEEKTLKRAENV
jgi:integrase